MFVDDEKKYVDQETGRTKIRGYPDLDTGLEIKNVSSATSENTISKHIGKSKKKANLAQIVIDVSENENLTDEKAEEYVANSLRRHRLNSALLVHHDGTIATVYPKKRGFIPLKRYKAPQKQYSASRPGGTGRRARPRSVWAVLVQCQSDW